METPADSTHAEIAERVEAVCNEVLQGARDMIEEVRTLREENARLQAQANAAHPGGSISGPFKLSV